LPREFAFDFSRSPQTGVDLDELLMLFMAQYHKTRPPNKKSGSVTESNPSHHSSEPRSKNGAPTNELSEKIEENWLESANKDIASDSESSVDLSTSINEEIAANLNDFLASHLNGEPDLELANELLVGLISATSAYIDFLIEQQQQDGGVAQLDQSPLPPSTLSAIKTEASTHLQTMLSSLLSSMQRESMEPKQKIRDAVGEEAFNHREEVEWKLRQLTSHPLSRISDNDDEATVEVREATIAAICSAFIQAPEIKQRIEPLVAYLVQTAFRNLGGSVYF